MEISYKSNYSDKAMNLKFNSIMKKTLLLKQFDTLSCDIITRILTTFIKDTIGRSVQVHDRLTECGYGRIDKFHILVKHLIRLHSNEVRFVKIQSLTSLERKALYSYRDRYGGICIERLPNIKSFESCDTCEKYKSGNYYRCSTCKREHSADIAKSHYRESVKIQYS
jgi:hypothetical protein